MSIPIIECVDVHKNFQQKLVLNGTTLMIPQGSVFGLLGKNGTGKTTLIKSLLGLLKIDSGNIAVLGADPWKFSNQVKERFGYVPQRERLYPWLTVRQLVDYTGSFYSHWNADLAQSLIVQWDIDFNAKVGTLSEGQAQKVVIISKLDISVEQLSKMKIYKWSKTKPLIIVCHKSYATNDIINKFQNYNILIIPVSGTTENLAIEEILKELGNREITSLLLEGGGGVYTSFLKAGLINKIHLFQALILIGNDGVPMINNLSINSIDSAHQLVNVAIEKLGNNLHIKGYLSTRKGNKCLPE